MRNANTSWIRLAQNASRFAISVASSISPIKGFDLLKFDRDIETILDVNGVSIEDCGLVFTEEGNVELSYFGTSEKGNTFEMRRVFKEIDGKIVIDHELLNIPEELQEKGIAKMLFKPMLHQYLGMGADEIELVANMDIGGYAWARYGFSTRNYFKANELFLFTGASKEVQKMAQDFIEKFYETLPRETPFPMKLLAAQPYGKELLLNTFWDGCLNLKDRKQVNYTKRYIGL